jgi:hypothetical protein
VKAKLFAIRPLRTMDQRWLPGSDVTARRISDMYYTVKDSWKAAGGFQPIVPDGEVTTTETTTTGTGDDAVTTTTTTVRTGAHFQNFGEIESIHWFSQQGGLRQFLVFESNHNSEGLKFHFFDGSDSGNKWSTFVDGKGTTMESRIEITTPHIRTQSVAWNGLLYLVNGRDTPMVFNGRYVERAGFDGPPGNPSGSATREACTLTRGLGLGRTGTETEFDEDDPRLLFGYRYRVSFVNERGQESPLSPACNTVIGKQSANEDGTNNIVKNDKPTDGDQYKWRKFVSLAIPTGGDTVVARRIYRTVNILNTNGDPSSLAVSERFYFLEEIQDNRTTTYVDGIPDGLLGPQVDPLDFGAFPQGAHLIASHQNRIFIASSDGDVRYSAPLQPEVFPVDNLFTFGDDDGGAVMGLYPSRGALWVLKRRGIHYISQRSDGSFSSAVYTRDVGCCAPDSVVEIPNLGVMFLSDGGVYLLKGALSGSGETSGLTKLSDAIPDEFKRINRSAAVQAVGTWCPQDSEYWLSVPIDGSDKNNHVFVFHREVGGWSFRENYPVSCAVVSSDHRRYFFFGSNDTTSNPGVHVYSHGWSTKGSHSISPMWESIDINFGGVFNAVNPKYVLVHTIGYGDNDIELKYRVNRHISDVEVAAKGQDQQNVEHRLGVYGTQRWGSTSAIWNEYVPVPVRFDVSTSSQPACRELRITLEAAGRQIEVLGFDLGLTAGAMVERLPINEVLLQTRR